MNCLYRMRQRNVQFCGQQQSVYLLCLNSYMILPERTKPNLLFLKNDVFQVVFLAWANNPLAFGECTHTPNRAERIRFLLNFSVSLQQYFVSYERRLCSLGRARIWKSHNPTYQDDCAPFPYMSSWLYNNVFETFVVFLAVWGRRGGPGVV